ncbi:hypothetical protein LCGC14_1121050 [marine sediment metagenome]|uniref:Uncharacterized protein n=1 Tax=marine sediment metagenome TaxID=412755 RepID=A0A0F9MRQ2_9ZZZZ
MAIDTAGMTADKVAEVLSLQARIEQCEAAIDTARGFVSRIESPVDGSATSDAVAGGAIAAIDRCNIQMADLNDRLATLAEKVGTL